jgi:hypothetical protein
MWRRACTPVQVTSDIYLLMRTLDRVSVKVDGSGERVVHTTERLYGLRRGDRIRGSHFVALPFDDIATVELCLVRR